MMMPQSLKDPREPAPGSTTPYLEPAAFSYTAGSNSKVEVPPYLVRARVRVRGLG